MQGTTQPQSNHDNFYFSASDTSTTSVAPFDYRSTGNDENTNNNNNSNNNNASLNDDIEVMAQCSWRHSIGKL
jgi:hypothetical protein